MDIKKSNYIKLIAIITMFIDHMGVILFPQHILFRIIGRIAFPLFAYQIGIGYAHTKSFTKYILRLLLFGIAIQLFYICSVYFFNVSQDPWHFNIFFTLTLGLLAVHLYNKKEHAFLLVLLFFIAGSLSMLKPFGVTLDYGIYGVLLILVLYIEKDLRRLAVYVAILSFIFGNFSSGNIQIYCVLSMLFIAFPLSLKIRIPGYVFYIFYPAHLVLLYAIGMLI